MSFLDGYKGRLGTYLINNGGAFKMRRYVEEIGVILFVWLTGLSSVCACKEIDLIVSPIDISTNRYGVKWLINDVDDEGSRCFDAIGKKAVIGVGKTKGYSDFDNIYPWSDIKRCNINTTADGQRIIIYEGSPGFSLEGSNGDVFVRIPRFCFEHYIKDDYEYRIISRNGDTIHPAFIERGEVLDEIFIAAFEGFIDEAGLLSSRGGVIPTSNQTGQFFLDAATKKGCNYTLYDNRAIDAIYSLMSVEYGLRNTNHFLGYGFSDYLQPIRWEPNMIIEQKANTNTIVLSLLTPDYKRLLPEGSNITVCRDNQQNILTQATILSVKDKDNKTYITFDGPPIDVDLSCFAGSAACTTNFCELCGKTSCLQWHTGRPEFITGSDVQNPIRYRWIENLFGSLWHFLPDVTFYNRQMFICDDMREYEMFKTDSPYQHIELKFDVNNDNGVRADVFGYNYWVDSMCPELFPKAIIFGESFNKALSSKQAFGSYYYMRDGCQIIVNGGGFDHLNRCNILTQRAWVSPETKWHLYGARLMYKPIS